MKILLLIVFAVIAIFVANASKIEHNEDYTVKFQKFAHHMLHRDHSSVYNLSMKSLPGCITMTSCRVCGPSSYYCGPGWCSDQYIAESSCVSEGIWGIPAASDSDNCVDNCCRTHDYCCGSGTDRAVCNTNIVSCLDDNDCGGLCSDAVWAAMKIVSHFCCGSRCPSYSANEKGDFIPMSLAGKSVCDKKSGLKLTFDTDTSVKISHKNGEQHCGSHKSVSLNQATNRVSFGTDALDRKKHGLVQLPETCESNGLFDKNALLKAWFFPHSGDLLLRDISKKGEYHNFNACR
jgi:hypothetical protein